MIVGESVIITSSDGTTRTERTKKVNGNYNGVTYGNNTFVIVIDSQYVQTSSNGTTWYDSQRGSSTTLYGVTYAD